VDSRGIQGRKYKLLIDPEKYKCLIDISNLKADASSVRNLKLSRFLFIR
jgi:hypothetical protein